MAGGERSVAGRAEARVLCAGILVADLVVPTLDRLPRAGELLSTDDFLVQPGGCAANSAIALRRLGVPVAVCGCVGDDLFGGWLEADLASRAIDTALVRQVAGYGTSKTVIVPVAGEDRRFIHTLGANAALTAEDLPAAALEAVDVVYVGGYLVLPGVRQEALAERCRHARASGTTILLDVVAPAEEPLSLEDVRLLLPHVDYFLPNEDEARALTGERDPVEQAMRFHEAGARTVIVKRGARGALVSDPGGAFELPAPPVDVVEPSGAGDAFAAGLVLGVLESWDIERQVCFASALGASACTALGCWAGVFTRDEADAFLARHPLEPRRPG